MEGIEMGDFSDDSWARNLAATPDRHPFPGAILV